MRSAALLVAALGALVVSLPSAVAAKTTSQRTRVYAIGDSVMIDTKSDLRHDISGIVINADVSRQVAAGIRILQRQQRNGTIARTTVFGLGTNGTFTAAQMRQAVRLTADHKLVVITTHCPYCDWTARNNRTVRKWCTRARHCWVAAFQGSARNHPEWFTDDGVHMPPHSAGTRRYAAIVRDAVIAATG